MWFPSQSHAALFGKPKGDVIEVYRDDHFQGGVPLLQDGEMPYVFLSDAALIFRGTLHWFQVSGKVRLAVGQHWVDFFPGEPTVNIDGEHHALTPPLAEIRGKLAVPVSWLASSPFMQAVGYQVTWNRAAHTLQLASVASPSAPSPPAPPPAFSPLGPAPKVPPPAASLPRPGHRIRRIVVDAGHGGHDPGAVGYRGTKEKDINLFFAREVARTLREKGRYEVFLTREDDTFLPLAERAQFANERQADLFLSIHCNASMSSTGRGFEIYFLSEKASDPQAAAVARFENSVIELERHSPKEREGVARLLRSLIRTDTINEASALCGVIARQVERRGITENRGVRQAGFYVLRGTEMPAALIELSFVTNPRDERNLRNRRFRRRMVEALLAGVREYDGRPPAGEAKGL